MKRHVVFDGPSSKNRFLAHKSMGTSAVVFHLSIVRAFHPTMRFPIVIQSRNSLWIPKYNTTAVDKVPCNVIVYISLLAEVFWNHSVDLCRWTCLFHYIKRKPASCEPRTRRHAFLPCLLFKYLVLIPIMFIG